MISLKTNTMSARLVSNTPNKTDNDKPIFASFFRSSPTEDSSFGWVVIMVDAT